ncbi:MAG TPA: PAS domain-containing protein [Steroidobacteraceae bacterium]|nr:PAS domain-containing protein [Steroidobacteraceae bacterium]
MATILAMARKGLRLDLRAALREAIATRTTSVRHNILMDDEEGRIQPLTLTVEPLANRSSGEPLFIVLFEPAGPSRSHTEAEQGERATDATADLERELRDTRERLQSTIEEYETALEELKSSNEELVSVNEESQSTNEELEASKEELQSLNEEPNTINAELTGKVEDLDRANCDLKNLFESSQIATVFLDGNLVVRNFTPAASSIFNLRAADIGGPLTDLSSRLEYAELEKDIGEVFRSGARPQGTAQAGGTGDAAGGCRADDPAWRTLRTGWSCRAPRPRPVIFLDTNVWIALCGGHVAFRTAPRHYYRHRYAEGRNMATLKLTAVGTSTGVVIPKEMLTHMRVERGDVLHVVETPEGYLLTPFDPAIEAQLKAGREFMKEYRDTFKVLAK